MTIERAAVPLVPKHVEVDVRGVVMAVLRDEHRGARDASALGAFEDKEVLPLKWILDSAGEAGGGLLDQLLHDRSVLREVHRVQVPGELVQGFQIPRRRLSQEEGLIQGLEGHDRACFG